MIKPLAERLLWSVDRVTRDPSDVQGVHQARVTARRLLAAGQLWCPESGGWEEAEARLAKLVRRLGGVRNADVTLALLMKGKRADRAARSGFIGWLRRRRRKERARLAKWLTARRIRKLGEILRNLIRDERSPAVPAPGALDRHFGKIIGLAGPSPWWSDPAAAHEVRREVRLLRYALETLTWAYSKSDLRRIRRRLQEVQDRAGAWHDRCVLEKLAVRASREGDCPVSLGPLLHRVRREEKILAQRFVTSVTSLMDLRPLIVKGEAK